MCPRDQQAINFVDNIFSSEATSLSSLVAISLVKMEIKRSSFVTLSPEIASKGSPDFVGAGPLLYLTSLPSLVAISLLEAEIQSR